MRHKTYERLLILSMSETLDPADEDVLARHMEGCARCRRDLAALKTITRSSQHLKEAAVFDDALLQEARRDLHVLLRREAYGQRPVLQARRTFRLRPGVRYGFGFALTFIVGLGIGVYQWPWHSDGPGSTPTPMMTTAAASSPVPGRTKITNVQFIDRGSSSGVVEFTFDAVTPVHMRGTIDDPAVQKVLVNAVVNDDNPGVRLTAVNAFASAPPVKSDSAVKAVMIRALKFDPNIGVRKQALVALRSMPMDNDIRQALLATLRSDANPGLRIAAINALEPVLSKPGALDPTIREVLQQRAESDKNDYIRLKAKAVLLENH